MKQSVDVHSVTEANVTLNALSTKRLAFSASLKKICLTILRVYYKEKVKLLLISFLTNSKMLNENMTFIGSQECRRGA